MFELIRNDILSALKECGLDMAAQDFLIEVPPKAEFGDFSANVALKIAAANKSNPLEIAREVTSKLAKNKNYKKVEIAGPGFINLFLSPSLYQKMLEKILSEKEKFGIDNVGNDESVCVEFVSANPTGPLHVGNARGGPIGEAIANLYQFFGYKVIREFYINDIGGQINRYGETLYYWYEKLCGRECVLPEDGYKGDFPKQITEQIIKTKKAELEKLVEKDDFLAFLAKEGVKVAVSQIKTDLKLINIEFDKWTYQTAVEEGGKPEKIIEKLEQAGVTAKMEGALWFKDPAFTDLEDKESVLTKSDDKKTLTYFADDIAYHAQKFEDSNILVDVWGANHHGHIARMKAAMSALGFDPEKLKIILYQYVQLKNAGEIEKMSKRAGNFVSLRQVIEGGVKPDAFKFFVLSQNQNTPIEFDFKLACDTSEKNPVFYIKYAHARIASIIRKAGKVSDYKIDIKDINSEIEQKLYKKLAIYPDILKNSLNDLELQRVAQYAFDLAGMFHEFYASCLIISKDGKVDKSRLALAFATKTIIKSALFILGIEAPEKM